MGHFAKEYRAPRSKDNRNWNQDGAGFDWSDMVEEEIQANMALMAFLDTESASFKASTYKRGLSILEEQIIKYKESEVLFSEEIALLKRSVGHKEYLMGLLRTELEKEEEEPKKARENNECSNHVKIGCQMMKDDVAYP
ncbi:hypothetical protein Tco_0550304 [Tanacetum coccineum]